LTSRHHPAKNQYYLQLATPDQRAALMLSKHLKRKWQQILSASDDSTAKLATTVSLLSTTMSNAISLEDITRSEIHGFTLRGKKRQFWISQFSAVERVEYSTKIELKKKRLQV
jgi:hypothetical protein